MLLRIPGFRRLLAKPEHTVCLADARLPAGAAVYAIGDIHGERTALARLLELIREDHLRTAGDLAPVAVFLGDYVDRGPDSRGVLDLLSGDCLPGFETRFLLGNHESAMLGFLDNPSRGAEWLAYGGAETLASYGLAVSVGAGGDERCRALRDTLAERLPPGHLDFLRRLEPCVTYGDFAFVHAGIRPGRRLDRQSREDLLWIREPFLDWRGLHEKVIVHGHTPVDEPEILANRIAIDTGAYFTGRLTALAIKDTNIRTIYAEGWGRPGD